MNTTSHFDDLAASWDADPSKRARAKAVADGIRNLVPLSPGMHGFEYGCGTGLLSFALLPGIARITATDSSEGMLSVLRRKIADTGTSGLHPVRLDLVSDPPPDEHYDLLFTMMTLHHIEDVDAILRTFFTLLSSPGYLCISDLDAEDGSFHDPGMVVHKGFEREALRRTVEQVGFRNVRFKTVHTITRDDPQDQRSYPVFLMVAEK